MWSFHFLLLDFSWEGKRLSLFYCTCSKGKAMLKGVNDLIKMLLWLSYCFIPLQNHKRPHHVEEWVSLCQMKNVIEWDGRYLIWPYEVLFLSFCFCFLFFQRRISFWYFFNQHYYYIMLRIIFWVQILTVLSYTKCVDSKQFLSSNLVTFEAILLLRISMFYSKFIIHA